MGWIPKDYQRVVKALLAQGWRYDDRGKGHPKLYPADRTQRPIPVPTTPGGGRAFDNWIGQIRRAGGNI